MHGRHEKIGLGKPFFTNVRQNYYLIAIIVKNMEGPKYARQAM